MKSKLSAFKLQKHSILTSHHYASIIYLIILNISTMQKKKNQNKNSMNLVYKTFQSGNNRFSQGKIRKIRFTNTEWWLFSDGDDNCNILLKYTHPYWNYPICQGKLNSHFCKHVCDFPFPWAFSKYDNFFLGHDYTA